MTAQERPPRGYVCLHWREGDTEGCCDRCLSELEEEPTMNEPEPENPPALYVAGLMFNSAMTAVALIRKVKPTWQAGKLNGSKNLRKLCLALNVSADYLLDTHQP